MTYSNANFTPSLKGYSNVKPFRFWCQKVLPLVYDDSLSYYELLCKVVDYLNNVISDLSATEDNVGDLLTAYNQLQDYVNNYFTNLDVQEEINTKLDAMFEDGTIPTMIEEYVHPFIETLNKNYAELDTQINATMTTQNENIATLTTRVNNLVINNTTNLTGYNVVTVESTTAQGGKTVTENIPASAEILQVCYSGYNDTNDTIKSDNISYTSTPNTPSSTQQQVVVTITDSTDTRFNVFITYAVSQSIEIAELTDIRVAFDRTEYPTAGDAVRAQTEKLFGYSANLLKNAYAEYSVPQWNQGRIAPTTGSAITSDTTAVYSSDTGGKADLHSNNKDYMFYIETPTGYTIQVFEYNSVGWTSFSQRSLDVTELPCIFTPVADKYYRFVLKRSTGTALSPSEVPEFKVYKIEKQSVIDELVTNLNDNVDSLNSQMNEIRETTANINTVGQGRYYVRNNGTIGASSENYIGMPSYVPCEESTKYSVTIFDSGVTSACGFYVCFYDSQGALIDTRLNVNTTAGYAVFESPVGGVFMTASVYNGSGINENAKITVIKGETKAKSYLPPVTATDLVARNLTETGNSLIDNCNKKLNKKIITWIDDDTGITAIPTVKSICDSFNIKCSFACITNRLSNTQLVDLLKEYQEEGFHITCHSHTHSTWYETNPYDAQEIENDLVISLETLNSNGFIDSDMLVYPGSSPSRSDVDVVRIVKKWCKCGVKSSGTNFTSYGNGEYLINRTFLDASEHDAQYYEGILDQYTSENAPWVVFGSHSSNATEFDSTMVNTVIQYALTNGWVFMTLNEALKYRQKYFDIQEIYSL